MVKKFLRRTWNRYAKLGKGRKKKQKWRNPTGRDNKMRLKKKGKPCTVSIGYGTNKETRGMLKEKTPVKISNINDLKKLKENQIGLIGNIGVKKKIEIAQYCLDNKIILSNLNPKSFLKNNKIKKKEKVEDKKTKKESKEKVKEEKK